MKKLGLIFGALVASIAMAQAAGPSATVSWTGSKTNVDGSTITGAITYNLYSGASATAVPFTVSVQKGMPGTTTTVPVVAGTQVCFAATESVGGVESAQSAPACVTPVSTPGAPSQVTIVVR